MVDDKLIDSTVFTLRKLAIANRPTAEPEVTNIMLMSADLIEKIRNDYAIATANHKMKKLMGMVFDA